MFNTGLFIIALCGYAVATLLIFRSTRQTNQNHTLAFIFASIAVSAHIIYAVNTSLMNASLNFSLSSMCVLLSAIIVVIFMLGCVIMPIRRLGLLIFPINILVLLFALLWDSPANLLSNHGIAFNLHILIAISAYSFLAIASIQALLYAYQERQIKNHNKPSLLLALPPLQTMESLLFRLLGLGFGLLSLTLISGAIFSHQIFGHAFTFKHHTIFAILGWLIFASLLIQRRRNGLRGSQAVIWTLSGFALIQLGYFGTKLVTESLNIQ